MSHDDQPSTLEPTLEATMYMPTKGQQIFLSLIGIPMSILSIVGSYFIIRHARTSKGHSAYRQIMTVASVCDIIWSASWIFQPFLSDTSLEFQTEEQVWIWAFGNSASCTFLGVMTQFGLSAHWFSGLISFYFLLTIRFQVKQATFAKYLPYIIGFIITWSVGTSIVGAVMDRFHAVGSSPGCWVGGDGFCEGDECETTVLLGWVIGGIPTLVLLIIVIVNNLILYCHVRRTVLDGQRRAMEAQMELSRYSTKVSTRLTSKSREVRQSGGGSRDSRISGISSDDVSLASIVDHTGEVKSIHGRSSGKSSFISKFSRSDASVFSTGASVTPFKNSVLRSSEKQWKRVQEVGRQSFLYVGAYLLSFGWTIFMFYLDSKNYEYQENSGNVFLPLIVIQSIMLPSMGFFNCCVYFRPKLLSVSREFPKESRIWRIRRAIYGNVIKPTPASARVSALPAPTEEPPETLRINFGGEVPMSSLARGDSEFGANDRTEYFEAMGSEDCSVIIEGELEESSRRIFRSEASQQASLNESKQEKPERILEEGQNDG